MISFLFMYLVLLKSAVHGHGRGKRLGTCLLYAPCVVAFVAYVNAYKFSVIYLILLNSVVHGHGRGMHLGTCLVLCACTSNWSKIRIFSFFALLGPAGKPTHFKSLNSNKIRPR